MAKEVKKPKVQEAEVPLSAMLDVVFLLLFYFITTQKPIVEDTLLTCDLPSPDAKTRQRNEPPPIFFSIDVFRMKTNAEQDLQYYGYNQNMIKFEDLKKILRSMSLTNKDQTVIINCDPNAEHRKLVQLLDACQEYGMTKLNIVDDATVQYKQMSGK